jgi:hypothetical protein
VNWIYPITVPTLDPEISAPLSFAMIVAGIDPAMEAIASALRRGVPVHVAFSAESGSNDGNQVQ